MACNGAAAVRRLRRFPRFNPWRVFSWLATSDLVIKEDEGDKFQSLAGFFVACNKTGRIDRMTDKYLFQSLAGFFVACNSRMEDAVKAAGGSFNPWRVFSWLATMSDDETAGVWIFVSIPGGFFRGLQPREPGPRRRPSPRFQSLAGFFVACNKIGTLPP